MNFVGGAKAEARSKLHLHFDIEGALKIRVVHALGKSARRGCPPSWAVFLHFLWLAFRLLSLSFSRPALSGLLLGFCRGIGGLGYPNG